MRSFYFFLFPAVVCSFSLKYRFDEWATTFEHRFIDNDHMQRTFETWVSNDKYIDVVNSKNLSFTLGHNYFSGMTTEEFKDHTGLTSITFPKMPKPIKNELCKFKCLSDKESSINGKLICYQYCDDSDYDNEVDNVSTSIKNELCKLSCLRDQESSTDGQMLCYQRCDNSKKINDLDSEVNWVKKGGVSAVKNQGQCGSCWSFSTTGALEGAYYVKYGILPSFSEQQLVDCDNFKNGGKDHGCNGGLMDNAFAWIEHNKGLCSESDYPYVSGTTKQAGICESTCSVIENSEIQSFVDVDPNSDNAFKSALMLQPVSIAIEADQQSFQLYKSGVFTDNCGTNLDHGVLAVGYGIDDNLEYYLVKNSWGTTWGDNGYIKLAQGNEYNNGKGQCGILMQPSYPEL